MSEEKKKYNYSYQDLVQFLRSCAVAADENNINAERAALFSKDPEYARLWVNGDLMREAANALEKLDQPKTTVYERMLWAVALGTFDQNTARRLLGLDGVTRSDEDVHRDLDEWDIPRHLPHMIRKAT